MVPAPSESRDETAQPGADLEPVLGQPRAAEVAGLHHDALQRQLGLGHLDDHAPRARRLQAGHQLPGPLADEGDADAVTARREPLDHGLARRIRRRPPRPDEHCGPHDGLALGGLDADDERVAGVALSGGGGPEGEQEEAEEIGHGICACDDGGKYGSRLVSER